MSAPSTMTLTPAAGFDFIDQELAQGTRATHPDKVMRDARRAKVAALLRVLDGLSFVEATGVLEDALILLNQSKATLLERSAFSSESCTPTGLEGRLS